MDSRRVAGTGEPAQRAYTPEDTAAPHQPDPAVLAGMLRSGAACPKCGALPAMRIGRALAATVARILRADSVVLSYQCQKRGCGQVYPITAGELVRREGGASRRRHTAPRPAEPGS